ncbi:hypothetical protein HDU96_001829 [Phlyctochytrium bullatum]|nr:hypothetical protein HDU96_001829 [Phlyctochytrium bullatum]
MAPSAVSPATLIAASVAAVLAAYTLWRTASPRKRKPATGLDELPTVPGGVPFLGNFSRMMFSPPETYVEISKKVGPVAKASMGFMDALFVGGEYLRWVFKGDGKYTSVGWPARWQKLLGKQSVVVVEGAAHKTMRMLLQKSVNKSTLSYFYPNLRKQARDLLARLASSGGDVDPRHEARGFTYAVICGFLASADASHQAALTALAEDFETWSAGLSDLFLPGWEGWSGAPSWMLGPFAKALRSRERIEVVIERVVAERRERMEKGERFEDALGILLEAGGEDGEMGMDEIKDNIITMAFAGFDTTGAVICTMFHVLLHILPASDLELLTQELRSLPPTPSGEDIPEPVLSTLPVLEAFVKEILRMYPPVQGVFRTVSQPTPLAPGKLPIPAGTNLLLRFESVHFDGDLHKDPESFSIGRWLGDETGGAAAQAGAWVPFGAGPRMCLGMQLARLELKVFLLELFRNFELTAGSKPSQRYRFPFNYFQPTIRLRPLANASA